MITVSTYAQQKVGVFGLGKAGEATIASLLAGSAHIYAWDDAYSAFPLKEKGGVGDGLQSYKHESAPPSLQKGESVQYIPVAEWPWEEMKALVLSPGVPFTHPAPHMVVELARKHNCPVIGDIELLYRTCPEATYVGITGTNGKSTTTTLVGHILQSAGMETEVGGNLGTAALSLNALSRGGIYVLELSSYQLDLLKTARFNVAAFLNVTPDHLDRHGSMEGYVVAKMHIFERQHAEDTAVIAVDDEYTAKIADHLLPRLSSARLIKVSSHQSILQGIYVKEGVLHDGEYKFDLSTLVNLTGRHNWQNAAVAYAVAKACGVAPEMIYSTMKNFGGFLRHRLQLVATIQGVRFINDSKATNADATSHALAAYQAIYWIAGGKAKAGGISMLSNYFSRIKHAFLIGMAEADFANTLDGKIAYTRCGTLEVAVKKAAEMAYRDSIQDQQNVVLLSPACASFDQWKSFEERGDAFCDMVEALKASQESQRHAV